MWGSETSDKILLGILLLLISISRLSLDIRCRVVAPTAEVSFTPPDAGVLTSGNGGHVSIADPLADIPVASRQGCPLAGALPSTGRRGHGSSAIDMGSATGNLRQSGGVGDALDALQRPVADVFPPNKNLHSAGNVAKELSVSRVINIFEWGIKKLTVGNVIKRWVCHFERCYYDDHGPEYSEGKWGLSVLNEKGTVRCVIVMLF